MSFWINQSCNFTAHLTLLSGKTPSFVSSHVPWEDYVTVAWKGWECFLDSPDDFVDKSCDLIYPLLYDLEKLLMAPDLCQASQFWRLNEIVTDQDYESRHLMPSQTLRMALFDYDGWIISWGVNINLSMNDSVSLTDLQWLLKSTIKIKQMDLLLENIQSSYQDWFSVAAWKRVQKNNSKKHISSWPHGLQKKNTVQRN